MLRPMLIMTIKELRDYFISPIAYIVVLAFLAVSGIIFNINLFVEDQANLRRLFEILPALFILFTAAVTMRSWAEERRDGNLEVTLALPVSKPAVVLAKVLSAFFFCLLALLATLPYVLTLNLLGQPDNGVILASYLGLSVVILSFVLIGQAISINTDSQIVAFIASALIITLLFASGEPAFLKFLPSNIQPWLEAISVSSHYRNIIKGVLDSRDVLYFISLAIFLFSLILISLNRIRRLGK